MGGEIKAGLNFGLWYKSSIWKNIPQGFQSNKSIWTSLSMVSCSSTIGISYSNRIFLSLMSNATFPSLNQRFHWSRNALWSGEIKFREFDGKHISSIRRSKWNKIMSPFLLQNFNFLNEFHCTSGRDAKNFELCFLLYLTSLHLWLIGRRKNQENSKIPSLKEQLHIPRQQE